MSETNPQGSATPPAQGKDYLTTLLLAIFLGSLGVDRFYTGHTGL